MSSETAHHLLAGSPPPGVASVAREDGAMIVQFRDETEVTIVRSFLAWIGDPTFELWLPRDERTGMATMLPKLTRHEVIDHLCRMADGISKRTA